MTTLPDFDKWGLTIFQEDGGWVDLSMALEEAFYQGEAHGRHRAEVEWWRDQDETFLTEPDDDELFALFEEADLMALDLDLEDPFLDFEDKDYV